MQISVRLGEPLWRTIGTRRLALELSQDVVTVGDVLTYLAVTYPDFGPAYRGEMPGRVLPYELFVNAHIVPPGTENEQTLQEGDKLTILLPAVGGSRQLRPLSREFFARPTLEVARNLLGQRLVREIDGGRLSGDIIEVEAYIGEEDQANHAARGPTPRNRAMYGPPGIAYVYLIYGMHHCLNVVTEETGFPAAVLIRGLVPREGIELMAANRPGRPSGQLTNGPGKLCQALAIDRRFDGHDLVAGIDLWLEPGSSTPGEYIMATPRIGVRGDRRARTVPWRFLDIRFVEKD